MVRDNTMHTRGKYFDIGVQTSPPSDALRGVQHLTPETQTQALATASKVDLRKSTPFRPKTAKPVLTYNRPNNIQPVVRKDEGNRVISLPERILAEALGDYNWSQYDLQPRSVSMPITLDRRSVPQITDDSAILQASPFSMDATEYARIRVSPRTPDLPHTPSPSSSFDESVEIIQASFKLSETFLKPIGPERVVRSDEDGWLTWANSPPRPIPALHGPASLPYARCPSGAEGTIIEEQSNVPRLIWGINSTIEDGGYSSDHSRSVSAGTARIYDNPNSASIDGSPAAFKTRASRKNQRFKESYQSENSYGKKDEHSLTENWSKPYAQPLSSKDTDLAEHKEPFDAEKIRDFAFRANSLGINTRFDDKNFNMDIGSGKSYDRAVQKVPVTSQSPENRFYGTRHLARKQDEIAALLKSNSSFSSPLRTSMKFDHNLNLNDNPTQSIQYSRPKHTDNRYGRNYLGQHLLPTPPDSTSPQWSSSFASLPNVLFSPETARAPVNHYSSSRSEIDWGLSDGVQKLGDLSHEIHNLILKSNRTEEKSATKNSLTLLSANSASSFSASSRHVANSVPNVSLPIHLKDLMPNSVLNRAMVTANSPLSPASLSFLSKYPDAASMMSTFDLPTSSAQEPEISPQKAVKPMRPNMSPFPRRLERRLSAVPEEESNGDANNLNDKTPTRVTPAPNASSKNRHTRYMKPAIVEEKTDEHFKQPRERKVLMAAASIDQDYRENKENTGRKRRLRLRNHNKNHNLV